MNGRERVLKAMNHEPTDRTPMDLGSSNVSSIHRHAYEKLLSYLGIKDDNIRMMERASALVIPCNEVLDYFGIDTRGVFLSHPKINKTVNHSENEYTDAWGAKNSRPEGGLYFDVSYSPLEHMDTLEEIIEYSFPEVKDIASNDGVAKVVESLRNKNEYAIVGSFGSSIFMKVQQIRGYAKTLEDMLIDKEIADYLLDKVLDIRIGLAGLLIDACGDKLDIIEMADDIAGQNGLLISPLLYREMIKPRTKKLIDYIKSRCKAKILYHSCGNIYPLIEDLIEAGVDILNPIQVSAGEMSDIGRLKREFGERLCFWGGIDSQKLLPLASPDMIRKAVIEAEKVLGQNGGYIKCASHNIQADIPVENILALYGK